MNSDEQFISTIKTLHPSNNAINILRDITNIPFFVYTLPKTGTSTLSLSLQKMMNNKEIYEHVVHCHVENCWKRTFKLDFDFDLMTLIKYQKRKPIIFQLSRDPIERLISVYFHLTRNRWKKEGNYKGLVDFLESQKNICNYRYYEEKFDVQLKNLIFCHKTKHCLVEKDDFILFYMKVEDFHHHLEKNVRKYLSHTQYNWQRFKQYISNARPKSKNTTQLLNELHVKGIPNNICQTIFDNNKDEIHFFFSPKERSAMEKRYRVTIN
jgi:hypothetical protein